MALPLDDSDQESRTASVGSKRRSRGDAEGDAHTISGSSTPRKKQRTNRSTHNIRDLPRGGTFATLPPQLSAGKTDDGTEVIDISSAEEDSQASSGSYLVPAMNWNKGVNGAIRTSLSRSQPPASGNNGTVARNQVLPQAHIGSGDHEATSSDSEESGEIVTGSEDKQRNSTVDRARPGHQRATAGREATIISDDSESDSGDDSGILLNVDTNKNEETEPNLETLSDGAGSESGEIESASSTQVGAEDLQYFTIDTRPTTPPKAKIRTASISQFDGPAELSTHGSKTCLGDLDTEELEAQAKYVFYHVPREELDLGRAAVCLYCFAEGHTDNFCSQKRCEHCGESNVHHSRNCPQYRRCSKCRDRGHDAEQCSAKLKDTSIPCDFCKSSRHTEDTCPETWMGWMPRPSEPIALHISCCRCGSRTHLVGDCPRRSNAPQTTISWTLSSMDPSQITNLSLQSGSFRSANAQNNTGPKPGMRIRGRADVAGGNRRALAEEYDDRDEEEQFFRAPVSNPGPSKQIRFGNNVRERPSERREPVAYDSNRSSDYRDRHDHHPLDYRRPRSRSPPSRSAYDTWKPPLPPGPPPRGPPPKSRNGDRSRRGGESYRPLPSAGKKNWDRLRL